MRKKHFVLTVVLFSLVFIFGLGQTTFSADPIILKFADPSKAGTSRTQAAEDTMKEIEKRTGGRVKHEFYWAQSLMKSKDVLPGIKKGTCDLGDATAVIYHKNRYPLWQFTQLLFGGGNDQYAVTKAFNELYDTNPILKKEADDQGVQLLSFSAITPTIIINKTPLREPKDFKGVRIRAVGPVSKFVGAMGGTPNPMKFYEVPEALARGVLDGTQSYVYASHAYKHYEYCKYLLLTGISHIPIEYWINLKTLEKMPPDVRKIYLDTWREVYLKLVVKYHDEERERQLSDFKKAGVTMYTLTPQQLAKWKEVAEPINDVYFKKMEKRGVDGRKIVAQYQALYKKYERK
jgi:TRAP-type C4-dicarboxylate transport system substrate-binding protein